MKTILNAEQIKKAIGKLADKIIADIPAGVEFAFIGVRSRGEIVAQRLAVSIAQKAHVFLPISNKTSSKQKFLTVQGDFGKIIDVVGEMSVYALCGIAVEGVIADLGSAGDPNGCSVEF
jgi:hypothetical protein